MADYTPEQVEALAEFARQVATGESDPEVTAHTLGILEGGHLADWLRKEDWADRAAREAWDVAMGKSLGRAAECKAIASIIRKHAEDRT